AAAVRDGACFQVGGDHAIDGAIHAGEARRQILTDAAEDSLDVFVEPALDEARRAMPSLLDRAAARLHIVAHSPQLLDELILGARLLVDPLELALDSDPERPGDRLGRVGGWLVQNVVRSVEHPPEEVQLAREDLEGESVGLVVRRDEVYDGDVVLLTV